MGLVDDAKKSEEKQTDWLPFLFFFERKRVVIAGEYPCWDIYTWQYRRKK